MTIWDQNQNLAGQTGDNVVIGGATYAIATDWGSGGGTGFTGAHVQIVKLGWGDTDNTHRTSKLKPIPVQIFDGVQGTTGALIDSAYNALKITGGVNINQKLELSGGQIDGHQKPTVTGIIQVVGPTFGKSGPTAYGPGLVNSSNFAPIKVTGAVQGIANGTPVAVTFGTTGDGALIRRLYGGPIGYDGRTGTDWEYANRNKIDRDIDYVAVQGIDKGYPIGITGTTGADGTHGSVPTRGLSYGYTNRDHAGDSVRVYGQPNARARVASPVEVTGGVVIAGMPAGTSFEFRNLEYGRDSIAIAGNDGTTGAHVKLFDSAGNALGASGGALKVAVDNGAFNITANVDPVVTIHGSTSGGIMVRGVTAAEIVVKGPLSGGALEVASPSGLNTRALSSSTDSVSLAPGDRSTINNIFTEVDSIEADIEQIAQRCDLFLGNLAMLQHYAKQIDDLKNLYPVAGETGGSHPVTIVGNQLPDALVSKSITVGRKAVAFPVAPLRSGINVQAAPSNTDNVLIGVSAVGSNTQGGGYVLEPGDSVFLEISNLNYLNGRSNSNTRQVINVIGS
tara:strand:+ start:2024 stop:3715 length:1692 start_codon:yes stop_codon:yes gene_type:complete